jgi:hypothetical protein
MVESMNHVVCLSTKIIQQLRGPVIAIYCHTRPMISPLVEDSISHFERQAVQAISSNHSLSACSVLGVAGSGHRVKNRAADLSTMSGSGPIAAAGRTIAATQRFDIPVFPAEGWARPLELTGPADASAGERETHLCGHACEVRLFHWLRPMQGVMIEHHYIAWFHKRSADTVRGILFIQLIVARIVLAVIDFADMKDLA